MALGSAIHGIIYDTFVNNKNQILSRILHMWRKRYGAEKTVDEIGQLIGRIVLNQ